MKAVQSLAQARDQADQGGLLRSSPEATELSSEAEEHPEESELESEVEFEMPGKLEIEVEEKEEEIEAEPPAPEFVDEIAGEDLFAEIISASTSGNGAKFTAEETIQLRLKKFAELFQERLDASDLVVVDDEGFALYEEPKENGDHGAPPLEKSGNPSGLVYHLRDVAHAVGFDEPVSTQIFLGGGKWLCLLYSTEDSDLEGIDADQQEPHRRHSIRAVVSKPLENRQLKKWCNLLDEALKPEVV